MATQTPTQRQASAKRAAATRKRNAAKRSATATRRGASATTTSARRTGGQGLDAAGMQLGAVVRSAQRAVLIPVGAVATASDAVMRTAQTYTNSGRRARQLDRFERRGAKALVRGRRKASPRSS